jgi:hypothetical protein
VLHVAIATYDPLESEKGLTCTHKQIQSLFKYAKTLTQEAAAAKAGMSLRTARSYLRKGAPLKREWIYRQTHKDAFERVWPEIETMLERDPGLQSQTLMQWLLDQHPGDFEWRQLRTLQRRIRKWIALKGPDQDIKFQQEHIAGKQSQSDWTHCSELGVTIARQPFPHMLFHFMLPFSRWETAYIAHSESFESLTSGYMKAVAELGAVAEEHRTDNLSAAVTSDGERRVFTERWQAFLNHYGVKPSANTPGESHENGSVEKSHHLLKNALHQALKLRGDKNFSSIEEYEKFIRRILDQRNKGRRPALAKEMSVLGPLPNRHWSDPKQVEAGVTSFSIISVDKVPYSVPSRLIGRRLRVLIYPEVLRVFLGDTFVQEMPRLKPGERGINYRHLVASLVRKPGAFENYAYREELFPTATFRRAYDTLRRNRPERASKEYVGILHLAAMNSEQDVNAALEAMLEAEELPSVRRLRELISAPAPPLPVVAIPPPELCSYDQLLTYLYRAPKETSQ